MRLTVVYDPRQEIIPLRAGIRSTNSRELTEFARRATEQGITQDDAEAVAALSRQIIDETGIAVERVREDVQTQWEAVAPQVLDRLQTMFATDWDPGDVTAYLTVSTRCPYSFPKRFFFVSLLRSTPIQTCVHELQHFFAHHLLEPIFAEQGKSSQFNDFKESLTVLLNERFADCLEAPDEGYPQHRALRQRILDSWRAGQSLAEIAKTW